MKHQLHLNWFCCGVVISAILLSCSIKTSSATDEKAIANGHFRISIPGETAKTIDFNAQLGSDDSTSGEMIFREVETPAPVAAEDGVDPQSNKPFFIRAEFDCLVVDGNKAVMSGGVTEASADRYVGRRVVLAVEDNGKGDISGKRDRITWGIYRTIRDAQSPIDIDRPDEPAGPMSWIAKDNDRDDDPGVLSNTRQEIGCHTYPISSFTFISANLGKGEIYVRSVAVPQK